jgi:hypothetical protein
MRIFVLTATYELTASRKSHLHNHPSRILIFQLQWYESYVKNLPQPQYTVQMEKEKIRNIAHQVLFVYFLYNCVTCNKGLHKRLIQ